MPNHESAVSMKLQLANALKERMRTMPLEKIRVKDLTDDCEVNRQTFYYHFDDIYDLLHWACVNEIRTATKISDPNVTWKESAELLMKYIEKNRDLCTLVLDTMGRRQLKNMFSGNIEQLLRKITENLQSKKLSPERTELLEFNIKYNSIAISGLLESWLLDEIKMPSEKILWYMEYIVKNNIQSLYESEDK